MHDSKLIQSIKVLKKEEIEGVKQLLNTDLLLKGSYKNEAIRLFEYIMPYYPEFESEALDRNIALEEIFKGEGSKINRLEKTMSALLNVVDYYVVHFISQTSVKTIADNITLSKFYRKRGYYNRCKNFLKKIENIKENEKELLEPEFYYQEYLFYEETLVIQDVFEQNFSYQLQMTVNDKIDEFAFLKKMDTFARSVFREFKFTEISALKFQELEKEINSNTKYLENPLIILNYYSLQMLKESETDLFLEKVNMFNRLLELNVNKINREYLEYLTFNESISANKRSSYFPTYENLLLSHNVSKKQLEKGFLLKNNMIHLVTALNLVYRGIRLKEYEWVKQFLEKYSNVIGFPFEREDCANFCWAMYYFTQKEYSKAESLIIPKYDNLLYQIFSRRLKMRIYYETKEEIILTYEIDAHKVYVHRLYGRKEIDVIHYETNTNFCNRLKQIINLRHNPDEKNKERLYKKVEEQKCSDKEWLLEKIEEIKVPYSKQ